MYRADKYTCCPRAPNSEGTGNPLTGTFSIFLTTLPGRPSCHRLRGVATELPGGPEPQEPLAATHHVGPVRLRRTPSPSRLLSASPTPSLGHFAWGQPCRSTLRGPERWDLGSFPSLSEGPSAAEVTLGTSATHQSRKPGSRPSVLLAQDEFNFEDIQSTPSVFGVNLLL